MKQPDPNNPIDTFESLWRATREYGKRPELYQILIDILCQEFTFIEGKTILEAGSGSGVHSVELSRRKAQCTLLDAAKTALEISKELYDQANLQAKHVRGDLFAMPFENATFDYVWNSGVLEHFQPDKTAKGIREMCRVCKPDGKVLAVVPSSNGVFYRIGKWVAEKRSNWPYGYERPIKSLFFSAPEGWYCEREYLLGVILQTNFMPGCLFIRPSLHAIVNFLAQGNEMSPWLSRILGGYALVSVFVHRR